MKFMRVFVILFLMSLYLMPAVSHAQTRVFIAENGTSESISLAFRYYKDGEWVTEGWWQAPARQTKEIVLPTDNDVVYVHAQSKSYIWPGETDSEDIRHMIVSNKFRALGTNTPSGQHRQTVDFDYVEFDSDGSVIYEFFE